MGIAEKSTGDKTWNVSVAHDIWQWDNNIHSVLPRPFWLSAPLCLCLWAAKPSHTVRRFIYILYCTRRPRLVAHARTPRLRTHPLIAKLPPSASLDRFQLTVDRVHAVVSLALQRQGYRAPQRTRTHMRACMRAYACIHNIACKTMTSCV